MTRFICETTLALSITACMLFGAGGCGAGATGDIPPPGDGGEDAGHDAGVECVDDQDCGPGLVCEGGFCKSTEDGGKPDAGPPEDEHLELQPPVGGQNYVFVVNTTLGTVAKIDPGELSNIEVDSIPVGVRPTILATVPDSDNAVVLNEGSRSLSVIQAGEEEDMVTEVPVGQAYTSMVLSPSGRWAVAYFDQSDDWVDPDSSASKIAVVDVAAALSGETRVHEFAVGYRVTDVVFKTAGTAPRLLIVSRSEVAVAELDRLEDTLILPRVWIDDPDAEVVEAREVLATPDAGTLIFRNFLTSELTFLDVESGQSSRLLLHGVPSDVDLSPDGSMLLAVQRSEGVVARIDLETDLENIVEVDGVTYFDPDGNGLPSPDEVTHVTVSGPDGQTLKIGQAVIYTDSGGELSAFLYSNIERAEELSVLDVGNMQVSYLGHLINKLVDYVVVSPSAQTALVIHRPEFNSSDPDPVEREVDSLNGYTLIDLPSLATFQQVIEAPVGPMSFSSTGRYALLTVFDSVIGVNELHVVDLLRLTLQMDSVPLDALPTFAGALPGVEIGYVAQEHAYGKITFVDMSSMAKRAVTGYELNAD